VHYKKLAPIIEQTAKEFNLPYYSKKTFVGALAGHAKLLYNLGRLPVPENVSVRVPAMA